MTQEQGQRIVPYDWLWDTPLFISGSRIDALYQAVALPETEEEYRTITDKVIKERKLGGSLGGEGSGDTGSGFLGFLPKLGLKATAALSGERTKQQEEGTQYTLRPVRSAERRLLHTCLFYAEEWADRCWTVSGLSKGPWMESDFIRKRPRALVFLDIAPGTPIVPMAAELDKGEVKTFYDRLNQEAVVSGMTDPPKWPDENDGSAAATYWAWYKQNADTSKVAMRLMERVIGDGGRPSWVDYRVPVWGSDGRAVTSLHLHVQGGEEYTTGDFAHRLVHRGRKHGLRVVGLLKEGPALNVLAVYER
jgi:hypothetical protein